MYRKSIISNWMLYHDELTSSYLSGEISPEDFQAHHEGYQDALDIELMENGFPPLRYDDDGKPLVNIS